MLNSGTKEIKGTSMKNKSLSQKINSILETSQTPNEILNKTGGAAEQPKDPRQTFVPVRDFQHSNKDWKAAGGVFVVYAKKVKRITLQRVLVSQLVFEKETFILGNLLVIYDNMIILQDMALKDEAFRRKFGSSLEELSDILRNSRITREPSKAGLSALSQKLRSLDKFLIPHRNLAHTGHFFKGKYEVRQGIKIGTPTTQLPPKRYIGIGYRDKGTARDLAFNGEPSWQQYCKMRLWDSLT